MELAYLFALILILGVTLFVLFIFLAILVGRVEGRKKTFIRIAREFGLTYKTHVYGPMFPILPATLYPAREVRGSINGKNVVVEDVFIGFLLPSAHVEPFVLLGLYSLANYPFVSNFLPATWCLNATQIRIDDVPRFLNSENSAQSGIPTVPVATLNITPKSFPVAASYEQIKQALQEIK
jgi:hypothetical protein